MVGNGALILLGIGLFCYIIGMVGILVGLTGTAWFINEESVARHNIVEGGLFKRCFINNNGETECNKRETLFEFEDRGKDLDLVKDVVISMLLGSALLCFVAFIIALVMICYRKKRSAWRCSAVASFVFGILSVIVGLAALGYAEYKFQEKWSAYKRGWSNILCWVGCAGIILGSVLTIILVCVTPVSRGREKNSGVHYVENMNPTYQHDYGTRH